MVDADFISASNMTLLRQAPMTADTFLSHAIKDIDATLGEGFAKKHPELIAAYIQTCAIDLGTAIIARGREGGVINRGGSDHDRGCLEPDRWSAVKKDDEVVSETK
jgi:hypothetical protein